MKQPHLNETIAELPIPTWSLSIFISTLSQSRLRSSRKAGLMTMERLNNNNNKILLAVNTHLSLAQLHFIVLWLYQPRDPFSSSAPPSPTTTTSTTSESTSAPTISGFLARRLWRPRMECVSSHSSQVTANHRFIYDLRSLGLPWARTQQQQQHT